MNYRKAIVALLFYYLHFHMLRWNQTLTHLLEYFGDIAYLLSCYNAEVFYS